MKMRTASSRVLSLVFLLSVSTVGFAADWPDWRGAMRDGISIEKNLPEKWSPGGENLAWKKPLGGRSAPIVIGNRVCVQNSVGKGATQQERVMCLNADTGATMWEYKFNVFSTDVPTHRIAWASPVADPATGAIYAMGADAELIALDREGKLRWSRRFTEEMGAITTHGGRTVSPIIDGDLVIVSFVSFAWGASQNGAYRILAMNKTTGEVQWVASPGGRPTDTVYSSPIVAMVGDGPNALREFIIGGSDGGGHALKPQDGQWIWSMPMAKRGINTNFVMKGNIAYGTHSEENFDTSEMGLLVAIDATQKGNLTKPVWSIKGFQGGFSSPVVVGDVYYQMDNSAVLYAYDAANGKELWHKALGTVQKASLVYGDGKLYVGTESGKFWILRPSREKCDVVSEVDMAARRTDGQPDEQVLASAAISNGRVFVVSTDALYAIGKKASNDKTPAPTIPAPGLAFGDPAYMIVTPTEVILKPGESVQLHAKVFDAAGLFKGEAKADWAVNKPGPPPPPPAAGAPPAPALPPQFLPGEVVDGKYTAPADAKLSAGEIRASVPGLTASARIRIIPPPPYSEDFDSATLGQAGVPAAWVNATGKYEIRDIGGSKALVKLKIELPFRERARTFFGAPDWKNYTVEADVRGIEKRRQMADAGLIAQNYSMILLGTHQRVELESWSYEGERTVKAEFAWKPETWYHMKLETQDLPDGKVRVRGKVWPKGEPEPTAWLVEKIDAAGTTHGAAGIYGNATAAEMYFDNIKVTSNK